MEVRLSNVTTQTVVIPPKGLLCEMQEVTLEEVQTTKDDTNEWLLQKITLPSNGLSKEQLQMGIDLILKYEDIFSSSDLDVGHCTKVQHRIELTDKTLLSKDIDEYLQRCMKK